MPENPSHTGLVAQGWNWDLEDAQDYVEEYGILDVGQMYTTASGLSEFDIELTTATGLSVTLNMNGTKNWGDGTTDTATSHTYSTVGKYTITCDGTEINPPIATGIFDQTSSNLNYYVKNVRLASITNIYNTLTFAYCYSLKNLLISKGLKTVPNYFVQSCPVLKLIILPDSLKN